MSQKGGERIGTKSSGKRVNQKLKTNLVMQYFLSKSSEDSFESAY